MIYERLILIAVSAKAVNPLNILLRMAGLWSWTCHHSKDPFVDSFFLKEFCFCFHPQCYYCITWDVLIPFCPSWYWFRYQNLHIRWVPIRYWRLKITLSYTSSLTFQCEILLNADICGFGLPDYQKPLVIENLAILIKRNVPTRQITTLAQ